MKGPAAAAAALLGAVALLGLARVLFPGAPPLYDGIGLPSEPYRYLTPPTGTPHTSKRPMSAVVPLPVADQKQSEGGASTGERPPQAQLVLQPNAFKFPPGLKRMTLIIRPVPLPSPLPSGAIDGNVYVFGAHGADGRSLTAVPGKGRVWLRAPSASGSPVVEQLVGGRWQQLPTTRFGAVLFGASYQQLGTFALVLGGSPASGGSGGGGNALLPVLLVGGLLIALLLVLVWLVRMRRSPAPPEARRG